METVTITKKHFDTAVKAGDRNVSSTCLIAQAVKSAFPRKHVTVGNYNVRVGGTIHHKVFQLPKSVQRLIARFDDLAYAYQPSKAEITTLAKLRDTLPVTFKMGE